MAGKGRFSIGTLMVVILFVAADCAVVRAIFWDLAIARWTILVIPMLNILLVGLIRMKQRRETRGFWIGFESVGWLLIGLLSIICRYDLALATAPVDWLEDQGWLSDNRPSDLVLSLLAVATMYTIPQLLTASIAGWLLNRYRVVIERRPLQTERMMPTSAAES
jgi:hypothetical protein